MVSTFLPQPARRSNHPAAPTPPQALAADPAIYERLAASIAPSIWQLEDVKKGVLCQLFGGVSKVGGWVGGAGCKAGAGAYMNLGVEECTGG